VYRHMTLHHVKKEGPECSLLGAVEQDQHIGLMLCFLPQRNYGSRLMDYSLSSEPAFWQGREGPSPKAPPLCPALWSRGVTRRLFCRLHFMWQRKRRKFAVRQLLLESRYIYSTADAVMPKLVQSSCITRVTRP